MRFRFSAGFATLVATMVFQVTAVRAVDNSAGGADLTWGNAGALVVAIPGYTVSSCQAVVGTDGSLYTLGSAWPMAGNPGVGHFAVVKLTPGGAVDTSFGTSGIAQYANGGDLDADALFLQADGKLVLAGHRLAYDTCLLTRLTASGAVDTTFGSNANNYSVSLSGDAVKALDLTSDGSILVLGSDAHNGTKMADVWVARINANGSLDTRFGDYSGGYYYSYTSYARPPSTTVDRLPLALRHDAQGRIEAFAVSPKSKWSSFYGTFAHMRWSADGSRDYTVGGGGIDEFSLSNADVETARITASGTGLWLLNKYSGYDSLFQRVTTDGARDPTFCQDGRTYVYPGTEAARPVDLWERAADGRVYLAGGFVSPLGLVRLRPDGRADTHFGTNSTQASTSPAVARGTAAGLCAQPSGRLIVHGSAPVNGTVAPNGFAFAAFHPGPLETNTAPVITQEPASQSVEVGAPAKFSVVTAPNDLVPWYRWSRNGRVITTYYAYQGNPLSFRATSLTDEGTYTVEVGNIAGSVTTQTFTLTLHAPPVIVTPPESFVGPQDGTHTFTATVTGRTPLSWQWYKDDAPYGGPSVNQTSAQPSLAVPVDAAHQGTYKIVVTNSEGTATSAAATLTLETGPPVVTASECDYERVADSQSVTQLSYTLFGTHPFTVQWQKNGRNYGARQTLNDSRTYLVLPASTASSGVYRCVVSNPKGSITTETLPLNIWPSPTVRMMPTRLLVQEGGDLWLTGMSYAHTDATGWQWLRNGIRVPGADNTTLGLNSATFADVGTYRVRMSTPEGTATSDTASVAMVEAGGRTYIGGEGKPVSLSVKAIGDGLSFHWRRDDAKAPALTTAGGYTGIDTATLTIPRVSAATHAGGYACVVTRSGGQTDPIAVSFTLQVETQLPILLDTQLPSGQVGTNYEFQFGSEPAASSYNVTGLPPGLACNSETGMVTGVPNKGGTYEVKVIAVNPLGPAPEASFTVVIAELPPGAVGIFAGTLVRGAIDPAALAFGTCTLTIASSGTYTGKIGYTFDSGTLRSASFSGRWGGMTDSLNSTSTAMTLVSPKAVSAGPAQLSLKWDPLSGLAATLTFQAGGDVKNFEFVARQKGWNATAHPATAFQGYHTAEVGSNSGADLPGIDAMGSGYAAFTPAADGTFTLVGRLPDGTAFTIPTFMDALGNASIFTWLHGYHGQLRGELTHNPGTAAPWLDSTAEGALVWQRPANPLAVRASPVDNTYFNGFTRTFNFLGTRYLPPGLPGVTGKLMLDASIDVPFVTLSLSGGDLPNASHDAVARLKPNNITIPSKYAASDAVELTALSFNPTTGLFTGTTREYGVDIDGNNWVRSGSVQGIVTRTNTTSTQSYGAGYFTRRTTANIFDNNDITPHLLKRGASLLLSGSVRIVSGLPDGW